MMNKKLLVGGLVAVVLILTVVLIKNERKIGPAQIGPGDQSNYGQADWDSVNQNNYGKDYSDSNGKNNYEKAEEKSSSLPSCGDKMDFFTVSPIKKGDYGVLVPLGNLNPTGHTFPTDHIYLYSKVTLPSGLGGASLSKPVYSPGDMWITDISVSEVIGGVTDYAISYKPCEEFRG